jgi:hypothetical protein
MVGVVCIYSRQRVVIEFLTTGCSSLLEIHRCLRDVYGEDAIAVSSDAGAVVLRVVERTLLTGPVVANQLWQQLQGL